MHKKYRSLPWFCTQRNEILNFTDVAYTNRQLYSGIEHGFIFLVCLSTSATLSYASLTVIESGACCGRGKNEIMYHEYIFTFTYKYLEG